MVKGKHSVNSTDKANKPKKERNYKKIPWHQCQCSGSSQISIQGDPDYHQFLSLYKIGRGNRTVLIIYDTENEKEEAKDLDQIFLDESTCITQLPNGELFCYGNRYGSGITVIIDRGYRLRVLPSGTSCHDSSALYFDNNIYCFGGYPGLNCPKSLIPPRKYDLIKNRWIGLALNQEDNDDCHSVIFNENILVSGRHSKNIWLYSIEIDSFSIIPYDFRWNTQKLLINVERLYLIEWDHQGFVYESEDEYHWKTIKFFFLTLVQN